MSSESRYKLLKNTYNNLSNTAVYIEDKEVVLTSGLTSLSVNNKGVDIQPTFNGHISLTSFNIKQPLSKQSNIPRDFIPGWFNVSPRKSFDLPILEETEEIVSTAVLIGVLLAL